MNICYKLVREFNDKFVSWGHEGLSKANKKWMLYYPINKKITAPGNSYFVAYEDIKYAEINGSFDNLIRGKKDSIILKCQVEEDLIYTKSLCSSIDGSLYGKFWNNISIVNKNGIRILVLNDDIKNTVPLEKVKSTALARSLKPIEFITIGHDVVFYMKKYGIQD